MPDPVVGLVLAAGGGSRYGMPKALVRADDGTPWVALAADVLVAGGCDDVVVVLGAMAEAAVHLVPSHAGIVVARGWQDGPGSTLAAGLDACAGSDAVAAVVTLVDLPHLSAGSVRRVVGDVPSAASLRRARYDDQVGHPVLLGRAHWASVVPTAAAGAGRYLTEHAAEPVDCTDLGGGDDVDLPDHGVGRPA